jgi:phosphatidylserine/phosphatidylglycerophosphate/cardiolipin synthase-like enzyme
VNDHLVALLAQPANLRSRLSQSLTNGALHPPYTVAAIRSGLGRGSDAELEPLCDALVGLDGKGITGRAIALALEAASYATAQAPPTDLVWSGPEVKDLHARDTRRVYDELVSAATASVWISTYAYWDGKHAFKSLADRMSALPDLQVSLLLNVGRKYGDHRPANELVRLFSDRFWNHDWPGERRPAVYYDPRSLDLDGAVGVLHAKAIVVDDRTALVTSANLTEAAFDRNIEVGVLSRDVQLAASLARHFRVLIDIGLLLTLPCV